MGKPVADSDRALISPRFFAPLIGRTAKRVVMTFDQRMTDRLRRRLGLDERGKAIVTARYYPPRKSNGVGLVGPTMGAPLAAAVAEILFACGTHSLLPVGSCGSLQPFAKLGSLIVPDSALSGEGTSRHYFSRQRVFNSDPQGCAELLRFLGDHGEQAFSGRVWTTDALFRETRGKLAELRAQGLIAVEMELSALCAVAKFRGGRSIVPLLIVSDLVHGKLWKPGSMLPTVRKRIERASELLADFLEQGGLAG
ncbi:MAG: nucleoside phosphorylase [Candidatus Alcyoniella australis]|nr:nucleoside phosphorylase [Candidatus Alcyoniella australis]